MTPQQNKRIQRIQRIIILWLLLPLIWGCSHVGRGKAVHDETVPSSAAPVEVVKKADVDALVDDDPFFADEEEYWDEEGETEDDLFVEDDDALFDSQVLVADPLQPFNRAMFTVNDKLYFWLLRPVAKGYNFITPTFFRKGVKNAFKNIAMPIRFVSSVLQGKFKGAGSELARFVVNTTVGVGGVWDPAEKYLHLEPCEEDFGQTLGKWGIGNGIYIVWPFFGPSTIRDTVGKAGDYFLHPLFYLDNEELVIALGALEVINDTSFRIGDYESVKNASMDPYVMVRDFYIQYRKKRIAE